MSSAEMQSYLPPTGEPEEAFPALLAASLRKLHLAAGGEASSADAIGEAAAHAGRAILSGQAFVELDALPPEAGAARLRAALAASPVAGRDAQRPLVLQDGRLYLARYWDYQRQLDAALAAQNQPVPGVDEARLRAELDRHFPAGAASPDWQKVAAATAVLRRLCVISGGPGTGKTSTVVRILAILLTLDPKLRVAIAAPTGKAAARVQESIRLQLESLKLPQQVADAMPREPHTLHRLLKYRPGTIRFRHGREQPLPYDVVVVDEASMLDLALAAKLCAALPPQARLILLGDKDQLSSVEAGAVYAGISSVRAVSAPWAKRLSALTGQAVQATPGSGPLPDAVTWLEHSYRFGAGSPLGQLARAINAGDAAATLALLRAGDAALAWSPGLPGVRVLAEQLADGFAPFVEAVRAQRPAAEVFAAFDRYRVLCSTREGTYGSARLGQLLVDGLRRRLHAPHAQAWFAGRPVLITANDYALRLFNGDVGIALPDAGGQLQVHFQAADGTVRTVSPMRLGNVHDAMAITVHRAQGSEFEEVAVVVEPTVVRGLGRALLYTAVTRARRSLKLWLREDAVAAAVR